MIAVLLVSMMFASEAEPFTILGYDLTLEVVPEARTVRGGATVTIQAAAASVESARFSLNRLLTLSSVQCGGKAVALTEGKEVGEGRELLVTLDPPLKKGERREILFRYEGTGLDPGADEPDWMGILLVRTDEIRMSHQAQWYPVAPRDDRALSILAAPIQLALTLPAGCESLGPGEARGRKPADGGREIHEWEMKRAGRASILAGKYQAETIKEGALEVRVLAFSEHRAGAKAWGKVALSALRALEARFGKVRHGSYGLAEMRIINRKKSYNYEADGFSVYAGVLFDGRTPIAEKIAHEVAHLWWGGQVCASGRGERFLKESLAEMSAYLYLLEVYGADEANALAARWLERYKNNPGKEEPIADATFRSPRYGEVIYAKGALALRALRDRIGAERFDRGLAAFLAKYAEKAPDLDDFLKAMRGAGGDAVRNWAKEWLEQTGLPPRE